MMKKLVHGASIAAISSATMGVMASVSAQNEPEAAAQDTIVVTGSFIRKRSQADLPSPITTVGSADISDIQAKDIADIINTLTINTGSQSNTDTFRNLATAGTANINLRGLGLQSTLVLLNGKRNPLNATQTNDGISFVDTNSLVPLIAIERLEVLKDGAAALYGSDAVAGVANFITVSDFDGAKFSGSFQFHTPSGQSQEDFQIQGLVGKTFDRGSVLLAASYFDRTGLSTSERRFSDLFAQDASALGNPGAFFLVPDAGSPNAGLAGTPIIDPTGCASAGGNPIVLAANLGGSGLDGGLCQFDFGGFSSLVPDERRVNVYAQAKYDITDSIEWSAEFGYTDIRSDREQSPTFPFLQSAIVPGVAPNNAFSTLLGEPINANFFGRAVGNGGTASIALFESDTYRFSTKLSGDNILNNGTWELSYTRGQNDFTTSIEDTVTNRFQCALAGIQGTSAINPSSGIADCDSFVGFSGAAPSGTFNPFATSFTTLTNSQELIDFLNVSNVVNSTSTLDVVEGVITTDLIELPAGAVAIALGGQYRRDELERDLDEIANADGFGFLIGGSDFSGVTDVYALFAEVSVPVNQWIDLQVAGRFEDFGDDGGTTFDPKVAVLARPTDWVSLRANYSTSFRAPTTFQTQGESTSLNNVVDPAGGTAFAAVRAFGSELSGVTLNPESSRAFGAGFTLQPVNGLQIDFDYFNFEFEDAITQVNFQALVNANPTDTRTFVGGIATEPCTADFTIVCRAGNPLNGAITQVNTQFANAEAIDTSGIDFRIAYDFDAGSIGNLRPSVEGTYLISYDIIDPTSGQVDGLGNRNFTNIGNANPQLRVNFGLNWENGPHTANFFARRIGSLDDDQNPGAVVESQTRIDIQYGLDVDDLIGSDIGARASIGVQNLTNETPPFVATNAGFDPRVHDPRGRIVRFGVDLQF